MTTIGSLFTGYAGLDLAVHATLGGNLAWVCDNDPGASRILAHRFPGVPNLGDITAVKWTPDCPTCAERTALYFRPDGERGYWCAACKEWWDLDIRFSDPAAAHIPSPVEIVTGGFPCTDLSPAGLMAGLTEGTRSGLWSQMARAIAALRPGLVLIENVRGLLSTKAGRGDAPDPPLHPLLVQLLEEADAEAATDPARDDLGSDDEDLGGDDQRPVLLRALGAVLGDLADLGYDAAWHGLRAADIGAPHGRFRVFILAWPAGDPDDLGREWAGRARQRGLRPEDSGRSPATDTGCDARPEDDPHEHPAPGHRRDTAAHPDGDALRQQPEPEPWRSGTPVTGLARPDAPADTPGDGWDEGRPEPTRDVGGPDAALGGDTDWGDYGPVIRRWETILGRPAPAPTEPSRNGGQRLSPRFVEFMMGLPAGWVTDVPGLSRNDQLKALGNGVVPWQAAEALRRLLAMKARAAA